MKSAFGFSAYGKSLQVDAALGVISLVPTLVTRDGERKGPHPAHGIYAGSSLQFSLGEGREIPFIEQQNIAIAFMHQHREQLRALSAFPGVESLSLGLHYRRSVASNVVMFSIDLLPRLMWHVLDCGCSLSEFVELDRVEAGVA